MNKQEVFDTVVRHLSKQGKRALRNFMCSYRTPDGLKCAVGCLIPDELYDPEMEGSLVSHIVTHYRDLPFYIKENVEILRKLQIAHDEVWRDGQDALVEELKSIASKFLIDSSVVDEVFKQ